MDAAAYVFLLVGIYLLRQVAVGRVKNLPEDTKDASIALLNGDVAEVQNVFSRRGTNVDTSSITDAVASSSPEGFGDVSTPNNEVVAKVMQLGAAARGYRRGDTGPAYYDCSGLVWKAVKDLGVYHGSRFTTSSFHSIAKSWTTKTDKPVAGDIVLWPTHHMGIYAGTDKMYSARSTAKGIGFSSISGDTGYFHRAPEYWHITGLSVVDLGFQHALGNDPVGGGRAP